MPGPLEHGDNGPNRGGCSPLLSHQSLGHILSLLQGHLAKANRRTWGQRFLRSKMFLQGLNYDISQALPWPNHALYTLETGSVVTLGQKQPVWPLGRMWKKWSEAKSRGGVWRRHSLSESIWACQGGQSVRPRRAPSPKAPKGEPSRTE